MPRTICFLLALSLWMGAVPLAAETREELAVQVRAAEIAFAKTMADRNLEAFGAHVAEEAVFFARDSVLRGKAAVLAGWRRYFEGPTPPFAWAPEEVEVLDSGTLAMTSGPVLDEKGRRIGTFNSIWRRGTDGRWQVVFDKGCPPCD